jgi:LysM repeat protein
MRHRSPGRWLAPLALVVAAVAVYAVATGNKSDGSSTSTSGDGRTSTSTTRQATTTTAKTRTTKRRTYVVKPGDVLSAIAVRTGLSVEELLALNPGVDAQTLQLR